MSGWWTSTGTGAGCPSEDPVSAAPCSTPGLVCPLPNQCCQPSASCTNGHWTISAPDCAQLCLACGPNLDCAANAVCVATSVANTVDYRCEVNPCSGAALSCLCAAPLCDADAATCVSTVGSVVTCETGTKG